MHGLLAGPPLPRDRPLRVIREGRAALHLQNRIKKFASDIWIYRNKDLIK